MKRATPLKALVVAVLVLPGIACSGPAIDTRAADTDAIESTPGPADPPSNIMNRDEYQHSPSFPPG
jgi:hypothetical protein